MPSLGRLALLALPLLSPLVAADPASPSPTKQTDSSNVNAIYTNANEAFQELLNALPEESLHAALNSLAHFRDGIFESDRHGVARVHQDNPPLATKLIVAAVQDLKKRQSPVPINGTAPSSSAPPASSSAPPPESSSAPPPESSPVLIPVSVQTTDAQGQSTIISSDILSKPTASVIVPVTRTDSRGQTEVASETKPAVIFSTTNSAGSAFETTSVADFVPTKGQVLTRTNAEGSTFLTTYTPGAGGISSIVLITTTDANGQQGVVTSYTYVDPEAATATDAGGAGSTAKPSLQRGAAPHHHAANAAVLGGTLGGIFALFI